MGSAVSAHEGIRKEWMNVFHAMQFTTQEVMKFYETYNGIDTDHSGSIDVSELLKFLNIESSLFTERIFAAFDKDGTGKIDFFEFVVSLWKFCALGKESISKFNEGTKFVWACILTVS
jgi:Ca2+-binding EF-hand superfamily protein